MFGTYGFDKLKPLGFSIHGCNGEYSRRIIRLEVLSSNKCLNLIAHYYLTAAKNLSGVPKIVKADNRTKHSVIYQMKIMSWILFP